MALLFAFQNDQHTLDSSYLKILIPCRRVYCMLHKAAAVRKAAPCSTTVLSTPLHMRQPLCLDKNELLEDQPSCEVRWFKMPIAVL